MVRVKTGTVTRWWVLDEVNQEENEHTYIYEIYNALHSRGWLESEARAVARRRGLGRNGREVE